MDTADSHDSAVQMLEEQAYNIVLADKNMPGKDDMDEEGMKLLQTIREKWPGTEIILMRGYATVKTAVEAMKLGAFDYIVKPFSLKSLFEKIERILAYRQFIHANGALSTYRLLHRQVLMLLENRANLPETDVVRHLTTVGAKIDLLFGSQREWEKVIRLQNDALERIEALAAKVKALTGKREPVGSLLDKILEAAKSCFLPPAP